MDMSIAEADTGSPAWMCRLVRPHGTAAPIAGVTCVDSFRHKRARPITATIATMHSPGR